MDLWDKIKNKVYGTLLILLIILSLGFGYATQHYKNKSEAQANEIVTIKADLKQANSLIETTKTQESKTNTISVKRQEDRKQITTVNNQTQEQLNATIKNNPDWANAAVPDSLLQSLKTD